MLIDQKNDLCVRFRTVMLQPSHADIPNDIVFYPVFLFLIFIHLFVVSVSSFFFLFFLSIRSFCLKYFYVADI